MTDWEKRYLDLAAFVGQWSKDRSTKVGCVIVGSHNEVRAIGYNGFVRGMDDDDDSKHERPEKYFWTEHAERNAIYHAALVGVSLKDCRMFLTWFPCVDCARAIVQSGIKELVAAPPNLDDTRWGQDFVRSQELLRQAKVSVTIREPTRSENNS
jgi:dCMP deaminase